MLPVAIDLGVTVEGEAVPDRIGLRSRALDDTIELDPRGASPPAEGWGRYVAAVARLLHGRGRPPRGFEGTVDSTVPIGAGLSSSAALTVSVALALCRAARVELPPLELARLAREAERVAVGVPCGLMDPATSLLGRRGHALLLDCGTEEHRLVRLPEGLAIAAVDSGTRHALEHSGYATRRAELQRALDAIGRSRPSELTADQAAAAARAAGLGEVALRRLRHVVSENGRVRRFVGVLEAERLDAEALGALLDQSHRSLRDDFEVSTPELDLLVELALDQGAIGARMVGGGFGGSILVLAEQARAEAIVRGVVAAYLERTGRTGRGFVCRSADGAARRYAAGSDRR